MKVKYVSIWEEGEVDSSAELDLSTGEVGSIEEAGYGDDYEFLIEEVIELNDGRRYIVERNENDIYCISKDSLKLINSFTVFPLISFHIEILIIGIL